MWLVDGFELDLRERLYEFCEFVAANPRIKVDPRLLDSRLSGLERQ